MYLGQGQSGQLPGPDCPHPRYITGGAAGRGGGLVSWLLPDPKGAPRGVGGDIRCQKNSQMNCSRNYGEMGPGEVH